jgi:hypothetical protein
MWGSKIVTNVSEERVGSDIIKAGWGGAVVRSQSDRSLTVVRQKDMVMDPAGPETKNDYTGEGH